MNDKYDAFKDELERINAKLDREQEQDARERLERITSRLHHALNIVEKLQTGLVKWSGKLTGLILDRKNAEYGKPHLNVGSMVYMIQLVYDTMTITPDGKALVRVGDELSLASYNAETDTWLLLNTTKFYSINVQGWDLVQEMRRAWLYGTFDAVKD